MSKIKVLLNDLWCKIKFWKSYEVDCGGFCFRWEYGSTWERCIKVVLGGILKESFVWNVDFVEGGAVNFKEQGFKDF